jgi:hypothetical protein
MINEPPETIKLLVKTTGFKILSYRVRKNEPIVVDVASKLSAQKEIPNDVLFPARALSGELVPVLGDEFTVLSYSPDSILFSFRSKLGKKVPVHLVSDIHFSKQYNYTNPPKLTPDSITISGPSAAIKTIRYVETMPLKLENVKESIHVKLSLASDKLIKTDVTEISVVIPVDKFVEGTVVVALRPVNVKQGCEMKLSPSKVKVHFIVSQSDYRHTNAALFDVVADIETKKHGKLKVDLITKPIFIHSVTIDPEEVDYTLSRQ